MVGQSGGKRERERERGAPTRQKLITAARYMGVGVINYRGGTTNSHLYRHTQKFMEHVLCAVWEIIPGLITKPACTRVCNYGEIK